MDAHTNLTDWFRMVEQLRAAWQSEQPVDLVQTHISAVLLGARHVLKLKKPVNFGFLNYSTLAKRREACEAEVTLNRRLCPDTYLGVETVHDNQGIASLTGPGPVIDYAVLMKRLPSDRMLDQLLVSGDVTETLMARLAKRLQTFHAASPRTPEIEHWGAWPQIRGQWQENFQQTRSFIGRTIASADFAFLEAWVNRELEARRELFDRRVRERRIVDGHGDLRCESICVTDGILFFDCIEFSDRLRCCDVASEVAFLAMDLAARGHPDLAYLFTERYNALAQDPDLNALLPFYRCYRAYVRGKVLSFRLDEADFTAEQKERDAARAAGFFALARRFASRLSGPTIVVVTGLSGTGKTTIARAIASELGLRVVSTDAVRHQLFGEQKQPSAYGQGAYSPEATARTYTELITQAHDLLRRDASVILDGTFLQAAQREQTERLAQEAGARLVWIECTLPPELARIRLAERCARQEGHSDATWETHLQQREAQAALAASKPAGRLVLDTSAPLADCALRACDWLR